MRTVTGRTDRVVVVGAGLGGLACALHLAGSGRQVTVLEREPVPGGRAGRLGVDGYEFDTGPTVLTMPDLIAEALGAVGEELRRLARPDPARPGLPGVLPGRLHAGRASPTPTRMAAEIARVCGPREADGYLRFVDYARELWRLERADFIDRNLDAPTDLLTGNLLRLVAGGAFGRLQTQDRPVLPRPAYPADLLLPGDVRRPRAARRAGHLRGHRVPGLGGRGLLPARRHARGLPGRWPARPRSTACRSATAPR